MLEPTQIPEPSQDKIIKIVREGLRHPYYDQVVKRAKIMRAWYSANDAFASDTSLKQEIVRRSPIESAEEYEYRLKTFDLIPFEHKFLQGQQRIYDDNNVSRTYSEFWKEKEKRFDDCGDDINTFFEDKVLYVNEVEGFGGIAFDIATDPQGKAINDDGKPVPYPYIIRASELVYYEYWHGILSLVVTSVKTGEDEEYRAFTPKNIYVFKGQKDAKPTVVPHTFKETPFIILKGAPDPDSGFKVGQPRRWNVAGVYLTACELLYDLKMGSLYFGHPIQYMHIDELKSIAGALDANDKLVGHVVKDKVGMIGVYTGEEPPKELFMQASMEGMQHLKSVIFDDLIPFIYQLVSVRDKSQIVHNASGRSKQFDSVEEQAMLSQTATDMEAIEKEVNRIMRVVRKDESEATIVYNKHHDLRTGDEVWTQFTEALQYGKTKDGQILIPKETLKHMLLEYLKKSSAPEETIEATKRELEDFYDKPTINEPTE